MSSIILVNIQPEVSKVYFDDVYKHIEYCARTCTNTRDKIKEDSKSFVDRLISMGHLSCLEHAAIDVTDEMIELDQLKDNDPSFGLVMSRAVLGSLRFRDLYEFSTIYKDIDKWQNLPRSRGLVTFNVKCSRVTSQQFERHRTLSYSERSLRYVDLKDGMFEVCMSDDVFARSEVKDTLAQSFKTYRNLRTSDIIKDEARFVLPMSTATEFCVSGDLTWWLQFLKLRYNIAASKEMIKVASMIYKLLPDEVHDYVENTEEIKEEFNKADEKLST